MTALVNRFALIGRSYPREAFETLHRSSLDTRAERRADRGGDRAIRLWRATGEPIILPKRLSA